MDPGGLQLITNASAYNNGFGALDEKYEIAVVESKINSLNDKLFDFKTPVRVVSSAVPSSGELNDLTDNKIHLNFVSDIIDGVTVTDNDRILFINRTFDLGQGVGKVGAQSGNGTFFAQGVYVVTSVAGGSLQMKFADDYVLGDVLPEGVKIPVLEGDTHADSVFENMTDTSLISSHLIGSTLFTFHKAGFANISQLDGTVAGFTSSNSLFKTPELQVNITSNNNGPAFLAPGLHQCNLYGPAAGQGLFVQKITDGTTIKYQMYPYDGDYRNLRMGSSVDFDSSTGNHAPVNIHTGNIDGTASLKQIGLYPPKTLQTAASLSGHFISSTHNTSGAEGNRIQFHTSNGTANAAPSTAVLGLTIENGHISTPGEVKCQSLSVQNVANEEALQIYRTNIPAVGGVSGNANLLPANRPVYFMNPGTDADTVAIGYTGFDASLNPVPEPVLEVDCENASNAKVVVHSSFYTSSGAITGSDANIKSDIEPIYGALSLISKLAPVSYKYKDGTSGRTHTGFIAQDVENQIESAKSGKWAFFVRNKETGLCGLRYEEMVGVNTRGIQELASENECLRQQVADLSRELEDLKTLVMNELFPPSKPPRLVRQKAMRSDSAQPKKKRKVAVKKEN